MAERVQDLDSLSTYIQTLVHSTNESLVDVTLPDALDITVAVWPQGLVRVWCHSDGAPPFTELAHQLEAISPLPVSGPIAFVIRSDVKPSSHGSLPSMPDAWTNAVSNAGRDNMSVEEVLAALLQQ